MKQMIVAMIVLGYVLVAPLGSARGAGTESPTGTQGPQASEAVEDGEAKWAAKAATVLEEMVEVPEKGIPRALLGRAKCVAVFPSVLKAGFIVGARYGDGLISCRQTDTQEWGPPAFFNIVGGSFGLQIGAQAVDLIMLVMNENGMEGLLKSTVTLGGGVSVAAGPVGREATLDTDVLLQSAMISYSRAKGLFAGADLSGSTIRYARLANAKVYGEKLVAKDVLFSARQVPASVKVFTDALATHAPSSATRSPDLVPRS